MKRVCKKIIGYTLILVMAAAMALPVYASDVIGLDKTAAYLLETVTDPVISTVGGEWTILGLARSGAQVPQSYYDKYYQNVVEELQSKEGRLTSVKYSEYARIILALTAIDRDVTNVGGYNLLEKLADYNSVIKQGVNGPIFALLALDSGNYSIPYVPGATVQTTRENLIAYILNKEITDAKGVKGGFSLSEDTPDADITGMALQALANYKSQPEIKAAIDRGLLVLDRLQKKNGGFSSMGAENSESIVQVIVAKSALGIDASPNVSALMEYCLDDGSVEHVLSKGTNLMASEQGLYALTAYARYLNGQPALYDMFDVKTTDTGGVTSGSPSSVAGNSPDVIKVTLNGQYLVFDQEPVNIEGSVLVPMRKIFEAMGAEIQWDQATQKVTGTLDNSTIELIIGNTTAAVNGTSVTLNVPAQLINSTTMVPVRFISESMNCQVEWEQDMKTVVITK